MTDRAIQIAVARADLIMCHVAVWPWKRIVASILLAAVAIQILKVVGRHE